MKDTARKALFKSEDFFEWCLIAVEADDDISTLELEKIVELCQFGVLHCQVLHGNVQTV